MKQKVTIEVTYEGAIGKISSVFDPEIPNLENLDLIQLSEEQMGCVAAVGVVFQALHGDNEINVERIKREIIGPRS